MTQAPQFSADVSVRPSLPEDAPRLGQIQVLAWQAAGVYPSAVLDQADPDAFSQAWSQAITNPPSAKHRMLSACEGPTVVGFAALAPADDNTGEIVALEVDPHYVNKGHGSRLLAACTDILKTTGASHVQAWALSEDYRRIEFYTAAGLAPVGVRRTLDTGDTPVIEQAYRAQFD